MAEKMFLRLPELVEKLLVFLDTKSTLCLAIAHPFAREVLQNQVTWRKLLKRSISEDSFNQQDKSNIKHLTEILRSLRNPKFLLLDLLQEICAKCPPMDPRPQRDFALSLGNWILMTCPSATHSSSYVSPFGFSLLEEVEGALGTAEQEIKMIELQRLQNGNNDALQLGNQNSSLLSALSSRADRQESKVGKLVVNEVICENQDQVLALSALLKKCKNVTVIKLLVMGDIGAKGWAQLADAVLSVANIRLVSIQSSREMMKTAHKTALKTIWGVLKHEWVVDSAEGEERFYKGSFHHQSLPCFLFCFPCFLLLELVLEEMGRDGDSMMWLRLKKYLKDSE